ncbi:MAG: PIG-L family deacetylase [Verrucomicrobiia bacterium]
MNMQWRVLALHFSFALVLFRTASAPAQNITEFPKFQKEDRVLILAPHPDDEIIGCAGVILHALKSGAAVKVVYLTNGDNNIFSILFSNPLLFPLRLVTLTEGAFISLGRHRQEEAIKAMAILGIKKEDLIFLGYPDHGTDQMFVFNWNNNRPYTSMFARQSSVPYAESRSYKKEFKGNNILGDLKTIALDYKPTKIFVSHPADVNGDHWALYLYLQVVLADLLDEMPEPQVYPYLVHILNWPRPHNYHPELKMEPPAQKFFDDLNASVKWKQALLTPEEIEKKHEALLAYNSQTRISAFYLLSFVRQTELFSDLPLITVKRQKSLKTPGEPDGNCAFTSDTQWVGFAVVDDCLLIKAKRPKELKVGPAYLFFIATYKFGEEFGKMPNIAILTQYDKFRMYDTLGAKRPLDAKGTSLKLNPDSLIVKIPLSLLKDLDGFIFAFDSTGRKIVPSGCTAFRKVIIEK